MDWPGALRLGFFVGRGEFSDGNRRTARGDSVRKPVYEHAGHRVIIRLEGQQRMGALAVRLRRLFPGVGEWRHVAGRRGTEIAAIVQGGFRTRRLDKWKTTDPDPAQSKCGRSLRRASRGITPFRVTGTSKYQPPLRSPHSIALLKDVMVGDFELTASAENERRPAPPRSVHLLGLPGPGPLLLRPSRGASRPARQPDLHRERRAAHKDLRGQARAPPGPTAGTRSKSCARSPTARSKSISTT